MISGEEERRRRHFEIERRLAQRLRTSTREERTALFKDLYTQLFQELPDHPRLTRRDSEEASRKNVAGQLRLLDSLLNPDSVFVEFAPGDCRLAYAVAERVSQVYGIDISDQSGDPSQGAAPKNFHLKVYDGYHLELPAGIADTLFSYQFLEHLHPDDVDLHFQLANRVLKPGGCYVFSTPHRFSGPHDISRYFSDEPLGFHLKEWTYREMFEILKANGFSEAYTFRFGKARRQPAANEATLAIEQMLRVLPRKLQKKLSARLFEAVTMIAIKDRQ